MNTLVTRITCTNDTNGNPRRGWVLSDPWSNVFIDEGYAGRSALNQYLRLKGAKEGYEISDTTSGPELEVTPKQYRDLKKSGVQS